MPDLPPETANEAEGNGVVRGLKRVHSQLWRFVAQRKKVAALSAGILAVAFIGVVLWMSGLLGDGEAPPSTTVENTPSPETARAVNFSANPVSPVTAVPSSPECNRTPSASTTGIELTSSEIQDAALTGVVQILTDVGAGSGIVADPAGLIVTDSQVVAGSWLIKVRLASGKTINAELLGISEEVGVAYIEVSTQETLTALPMGNSDEICIGDAVFAVGYVNDSPSGTTPTLTKSRISFMREDFFSTNIPLDTHTAGGPLIDSWGNVIGVNSAGIMVGKESATSAIIFAIPINGIKQEINDGLDQSELTTSVRSEVESARSP